MGTSSPPPRSDLAPDDAPAGPAAAPGDVRDGSTVDVVPIAIRRLRRSVWWGLPLVAGIGLLAMLTLRRAQTVAPATQGQHSALRVRVVDPAGLPVVSAAVFGGFRVFGDRPEPNAIVFLGHTNTAGILAISPLHRQTSASFTAFLSVHKSQFASEIRPWPSDPRSDVWVELEAGLSVEVRVRTLAGAPVVRAQVFRLTNDGAQTSAVVTNEQGVAQLIAPVAAEVRVIVEAAGFESGHGRLGPGQRVLELVLDRSGAIAGQVVGPNGEPAVGAVVTLAGSGVWPPRSVSGTAGGHFTFSDVPPGVYELRATKSAFVSPSLYGVALAGNETRSVTLRLIRGAVFSGRVLSARDDTPVERAQIVINAESLGTTPSVAETNSDGSFEVPGLLPKRHHITVRAEGFVSQTLEEFPKADLVVRLRRGSLVEGRVVDPSGLPVAGATLSVRGIGDQGELLLPDAYGVPFQQALFQAQLGQHRAAMGAGSGDGLSEGRAPLGHLGITTGPVPLIPHNTTTPSLDSDPGEVSSSAFPTTRDDGSFRLHALPPGSLRVIARHPDYASGESAAFVSLPGGEESGIQIVLQPGGSVAVGVVDPSESPVSGIRLELRCTDDPHPRLAMSDDSGEAVFPGVLGDFVVTAFPHGEVPVRQTGTAVEGETNDIRLVVSQETHGLEVHFVDRSGFPVSGGRALLLSLRPETPVRKRAVSDSEGLARFTGLPAPPWLLRAEHPEYVTLRTTLEDEPEGNLEQVFRTGFRLSGTIIDDWSDTPVTTATIALEPAGTEAPVVRRTGSDETGTFELSNVAPNAYRLRITADGLLPTTRTLRRGDFPVGSVREGAAVRIGVVRLRPAGGAHGVVVDALGDPVAGATVSAGDLQIRSAPDGSFAFDNLPPGNVDIHARHLAAGSASEGGLLVRAKEVLEGIRIRLPRRFDLEGVAPEEALATGLAVDVEDTAEGPRIVALAPGSGAERAGLQIGDIVLQVDQRPVSSRTELLNALAGPVGLELVLQVARAGVELRLIGRREAIRRTDR